MVERYLNSEAAVVVAAAAVEAAVVVVAAVALVVEAFHYKASGTFPLLHSSSK